MPVLMMQSSVASSTLQGFSTKREGSPEQFLQTSQSSNKLATKDYSQNNYIAYANLHSNSLKNFSTEEEEEEQQQQQEQDFSSDFQQRLRFVSSASKFPTHSDQNSAFSHSLELDYEPRQRTNTINVLLKSNGVNHQTNLSGISFSGVEGSEEQRTKLVSREKESGSVRFRFDTFENFELSDENLNGRNEPPGFGRRRSKSQGCGLPNRGSLFEQDDDPFNILEYCTVNNINNSNNNNNNSNKKNLSKVELSKSQLIETHEDSLTQRSSNSTLSHQSFEKSVKNRSRLAGDNIWANELAAQSVEAEFAGRKFASSFNAVDELESSYMSKKLLPSATVPLRLQPSFDHLEAVSRDRAESDIGRYYSIRKSNLPTNANLLSSNSSRLNFSDDTPNLFSKQDSGDVGSQAFYPPTYSPLSSGKFQQLPSSHSPNNLNYHADFNMSMQHQKPFNTQHLQLLQQQQQQQQQQANFYNSQQQLQQQEKFQQYQQHQQLSPLTSQMQYERPSLLASAGDVNAGLNKGDWLCTGCGNINYSWRHVCNMRKCRAPKPGHLQTTPNPPGSWACSSCGNLNYAERLVCNMRKCRAPKPNHNPMLNSDFSMLSTTNSSTYPYNDSYSNIWA